MKDNGLELLILGLPTKKGFVFPAPTYLVTPQVKRGISYDTPRYACETDFTNPYFVIVHQNVIALEVAAGNLDSTVADKVNKEIEGIKLRHPTSWTKGSPFSVPLGIPKNRPILVCGAYENVCVASQYDKLMNAGYNAYISREGILSYSDLND